MAEYQYYNDFTLTNIKNRNIKALSDFGGQVYNPNNDKLSKNLLPEINHIVDKNENIDGERYIKSVYGTRIIEVPCFFQGSNGTLDLDDLNKWLGNKHQQVFSWKGDYKEIDVIYKSSIDMDIFYGSEFNSVVVLSFIAHDPYWRLKNEKPIIYKNLILNNKEIIPCRGNANSHPLIKITPNGTQAKIRFKWNDIEIQLSNIDKPFYIDCKKQRCYEYVGGIITPTLVKYKSDAFLHFPIIDYEIKNSFTLLEGSISELSIQSNTKII